MLFNVRLEIFDDDLIMLASTIMGRKHLRALSTYGFPIAPPASPVILVEASNEDLLNSAVDKKQRYRASLMNALHNKGVKICL